MRYWINSLALVLVVTTVVVVLLAGAAGARRPLPPVYFRTGLVMDLQTGLRHTVAMPRYTSPNGLHTLTTETTDYDAQRVLMNGRSLGVYRMPVIYARWSDDSSRVLVMTGVRNMGYALHWAAPTDDHLTPLVNSTGFIQAQPAPNGRWVARVGSRDGLRGLAVFDETTSHWLHNSAGTGFAWSPDSAHVVFITKDASLSLYNVAMDTYTPLDVSRPLSVQWSPNGETLLVTHANATGEDALLLHADARTSLAAPQVRSRRVGHLAWSPAGRYLAVEVVSNVLSIPHRLYLYEVDGIDHEVVWSIEGGPYSTLGWSADGQFLLYRRHIREGAEIGLLDVTTLHLRTLRDPDSGPLEGFGLP